MAGDGLAMKRLLFIRHGATAGNLEKRYIGRTDEPLCPEGVRQVMALREKLARPDRLYVSPMLRARQTARLLFPDMEATIVEALAETDFGKFEGRTADELAGDGDYRAWLEGMCLGPIPGGESVADFRKRCVAAFVELVEALPDNSCVAFVVHGGVIMAIMEACARPRRDFYAWHIGNGQCLDCLWDGDIHAPGDFPPSG